VDAGSIGSNLEFNRARGLSPFDVGYRVIEEYSKLQPFTPADHCLMEVYGDTIHLNDGTHLDGGIGVANDLIWQRRWAVAKSGLGGPEAVVPANKTRGWEKICEFAGQRIPRSAATQVEHLKS
jgi:hypothetical protein